MRRTCDDWIGPRGRSHARPAGVEWRGTDDGARFEALFTRLPCVILGAAAVCGAIGGSEWSRSAAPIPWVVAIFLVGLPHGAADYAVSRRTWQGGDLLLPWLAYGLSLLAVVIGFACAPLWVLGGFVVLSCWHFGSAHADGDGVPRPLWGDRVASSWARGGLVLAGPLVVWPMETAALVDDMLRLTHAAPGRSLSPAAVAAVGLGLAITVSAAWVAERWRAAWQARVARPRVPLSAELLAIGGLGCLTDPLFAVGLYFLVWHGWRQMEGLTHTIGGAPPRSWREVAMGIVHLHREAIPLLVPAWGLLGAAWWAWSPRHTGRDLALLSIAGYVVVTPAHEVLGMLVRRATFRNLRSGGGTVRARP